jgi:hypothetical protein
VYVRRSWRAPTGWRGRGTYIREVLGDGACVATYYGCISTTTITNHDYRQCKRLTSQTSRLECCDLHGIPKTPPASASASLLRHFPRHLRKCLANEIRVRQRHQVISSRQSLVGKGGGSTERRKTSQKESWGGHGREEVYYIPARHARMALPIRASRARRKAASTQRNGRCACRARGRARYLRVT